MDPLVSVIVNCRNGEKYLREALDSIYNQKYQNFEIIFFDNQSVDKSRLIAESYDDRLKYYSSMEYLPLGEARNQAIQYATGEYLAFLDADDLWMPDKLSLQINFFNHNPDVSFIYSNYWTLNQESNSVIPGLEGMQPEGMISDSIIFNYPIALVTAILKRDVLRSQNFLFDSSLEYYEEYDIFIRILFRFKAGYIPDILAIWRDHPQNTTRSYKKAGECRYLFQRYREEGIISGCLIPRSYIRLMRIAKRDRDYRTVIDIFLDGIKDTGVSLLIAGIQMYLENFISKLTKKRFNL